MKDQKIELPDVPFIFQYGQYNEDDLRQPDCRLIPYRDFQEVMRAYARVAIEADRKLTAKQLAAYDSLVASLEKNCTYMRMMYDELRARTNPDLLASERAANAILTAELEADRQSRSSIVNNASSSSEPVAVIRYERNTPGRENEMPRVISCNRLPDGDYPVFTAPQPAEPVNVPLDKAGAVGRVFSLVRRLKDGEPVEDELRQVIRQIAAEPVKVDAEASVLSEEIIEAVKAYGMAYSLPNTTATELTIRLQDIRAMIARYGNTQQEK